MTIGERIKMLRTENHMTQGELGEILGVGKATIQKYESGQIQNLKTSHIKTLCKLFDKPPHYFIFERDMLEFDMMNDEQFFQSVAYFYGSTVEKVIRGSVELNRDAQQKVLEYVSDLLKIIEYKKR